MPETGTNTGGIPRKTLIPLAVVVFFLSTFFSYSIFHHQESAAPVKNQPAQTARVLEPEVNSAENAPAEAAPAGSAESASAHALLPESAPAVKLAPTVQTAKIPTPAETTISKSMASPEKSPAGPAPEKTESAKIASKKTETTPKASAKSEAEPEAVPVLTQPKKEEVAKAPAGKGRGQLKLQIGEYQDLKSMLQDLSRVKDLGLETAFEEKEAEGAGKDYFLVLKKEFNEGEAKADSLKLKAIYKFENTIKSQPDSKDQIWVGPMDKLTDVVKNTKMLADKGYESRVEVKKKPGKKVYLFVGPFANKMEMIKAKAVLKNNGFSPETPALP